MEWLSLSEAALLRGVSTATVRATVSDGRVRWRWGCSPSRTKQRRREVWWPDMERCVFRGKGHGVGGGTASGPVTDETWARFCAVTDLLVKRMREEDCGG